MLFKGQVYYSELKINEVLINATTWMNLKNIMSKEARQKRPHGYDSIYMKYPGSYIHRYKK